jgi:hypothetical protein
VSSNLCGVCRSDAHPGECNPQGLAVEIARLRALHMGWQESLDLARAERDAARTRVADLVRENDQLRETMGEVAQQLNANSTPGRDGQRLWPDSGMAGAPNTPWDRIRAIEARLTRLENG